MKLQRLPNDPSALLDFFQEGLESLGAVSERSWHDCLHLVAEGTAARLWDAAGGLVETEIHFPPPEQSAPRDAAKEVFPGCPLTFHLADALRPSVLVLQRALLAPSEQSRPPAPEVAEKLWHLQAPGATRWKLAAPFKAGHHFTLLALVRCEIQAIDQHWFLHRLAISLPDGQRDQAFAGTLDFCQLTADSAEPVTWPATDPAAWQELIRQALAEELEPDLAGIRQRQQNYLRRELERVDDYFESYERELTQRHRRPQKENAKLKAEDRLAAARAEHHRRRLDQVQRHEIRVIPHLDALYLLGEPAWSTTVSFLRNNETQAQEAAFVPRSRRWML